MVSSTFTWYFICNVLTLLLWKPGGFESGRVVLSCLSIQPDHQVAIHLLCWKPDPTDPRAAGDQVSGPRSAPSPASSSRQRSVNTSPFPLVFFPCDPSPFISTLMINPFSVGFWLALLKGWEIAQPTKFYNTLFFWLRQSPFSNCFSLFPLSAFLFLFSLYLYFILIKALVGADQQSGTGRHRCSPWISPSGADTKAGLHLRIDFGSSTFAAGIVSI